MTSDQQFTGRMVQTVVTIAAVCLLVVASWAAREALLLIYVSALIAMGFSPLVRNLERPHGAKSRLPRWFAILLVYLAVIALFVMVALVVIPPLIAQATALWARLPDDFTRFQTFLIRYKVLQRRITLAEAVQTVPTGSSANAVGTVLVALSTFAGGIFAVITVLILSFYFLIEAGAM